MAARRQEFGKMHRHRACVVRDQNAILSRGKSEHIAIGQAFQACFGSTHQVERRLPIANSFDDGLIQIGIGEEADAHDVWRVRWSLAQRPGFASLMGTEDASIFRSFWSR